MIRGRVLFDPVELRQIAENELYCIQFNFATPSITTGLEISVLYKCGVLKQVDKRCGHGGRCEGEIFKLHSLISLHGSVRIWPACGVWPVGRISLPFRTYGVQAGLRIGSWIGSIIRNLTSQNVTWPLREVSQYLCSVLSIAIGLIHT